MNDKYKEKITRISDDTATNQHVGLNNNLTFTTHSGLLFNLNAKRPHNYICDVKEKLL